MSQRSAAAQLLDREAPDEYLREWTEILSAEQRVAETDFQSILVFRIGYEWLGLRTNVIEEVTDVGIIRRLPHRVGTLVRGIVSLRGEVLVCVALEVLLGLEKHESPKGAQAKQNRLIVCNANGGRLAFVAGEVHGVERYVPRELRPVPTTLSRSPDSCTMGILPWKSPQTIGCLDTELLFRALRKGLS